jgi:hypothetical protein
LEFRTDPAFEPEQKELMKELKTAETLSSARVDIGLLEKFNGYEEKSSTSQGSGTSYETKDHRRVSKVEDSIRVDEE